MSFAEPLLKVDDEFINLEHMVVARFNQAEEELTVWLAGYAEPIFFKGETAWQVVTELNKRAVHVVVRSQTLEAPE